MIRIIKADEPARTIITVDGRFAGGDYIGPLRPAVTRQSLRANQSCSFYKTFP